MKAVDTVYLPAVKPCRFIILVDVTSSAVSAGSSQGLGTNRSPLMTTSRIVDKILSSEVHLHAILISNIVRLPAAPALEVKIAAITPQPHTLLKGNILRVIQILITQTVDITPKQ